MAVAADVTDRYADGAWYVDLVPVTDVAMVGAVPPEAWMDLRFKLQPPADDLVAHRRRRLAGVINEYTYPQVA